MVVRISSTLQFLDVYKGMADCGLHLLIIADCGINLKQFISYQVYANAHASPMQQETTVISSKRETSIATKDNADGSSLSSSSGWGVFAKGLASGSVTRAAKEIVLHPIDTVKSRIQTSAVNSTSNEEILFSSNYISHEYTRGLFSIE